MANKRGAKPGERRGGRTAGTPNRGSVLTREQIESLADPIAIMATVARGEMIEAAPHGAWLSSTRGSSWRTIGNGKMSRLNTKPCHLIRNCELGIHYIKTR